MKWPRILQLAALCALVAGAILIADYLGPRWLFIRVVPYRGAGLVVNDSSLALGRRIDVATFAITPPRFGGQVDRELRFVPRLDGLVGLALSESDAASVDFSNFNCEIIVMPKGWKGDELPANVPFFRQGPLDGTFWVRLPRPDLSEVWFVPGPGSTWSLDALRPGGSYTVSVNLNGGVAAAAGKAESDLPARIPVRIIVW